MNLDTVDTTLKPIYKTISTRVGLLSIPPRGKLCYSMAKEDQTMAQQLEPVTFDEFLSNAASIFAQIEQKGRGVLVEHDGALFSVEMKRPRTKKRGRGITSQDSILHIIGIGASQGPTDTSTNKHRYLADAAGDLHDV
jgi:hypothetical protein